MTRRDAFLIAALFVLSVALNWPLFPPGDSPYRDSIEGGYRGMSRFLTEHPSAWGWNPLQYCGLPTQYMYVPSLHYMTATVSTVLGTQPQATYKALTAALACMAPATLFGFVLFFVGSRWWALSTALAYTFFSPLYGLIVQVDKDRGIIYLPWRLHVFSKYGEAPHNIGLMLIPLALIALYLAATRRRPWHIPAAALLLALIPLTNWVAALGLAVCCGVLLLATIGAEGEFRRRRIFGAAALAYGLACFWLTPTFIHTVAFNWPVDSFNYKLQLAQRWLLVGWIVGLIAVRALAWWLRWPFYETFVSLGVWAFGYPVLIFYSYGIDMLPESRRYAIEFEMFLVLALFAFFRFCFSGTNRVRQVCGATVALALAAVAAPTAARYLTQGYSRWMPIPKEQTTEYKVARFLADQNPRGRVLASGGLRFRLNSWFDLHQVGGAFESGLRNRVPVHFAYQIRTSIGSTPETDAADSIRQMKALGVEYVVIHGPNSAEHYRDYKNPMKFEGVLDRVFSAEDDYVYRVPFRGLAHLVKPAEQPLYALKDWFGGYIGALDDASRPALQLRWRGPAEVEVRGPVPEGHTVTLAVTYEEGWQATQDGKPIEIEPNKLNFIVAKARPSAESVILFRYAGTPEQRLMFVVSSFVWMGTAAWLWRRMRSQYHGERWKTPPARTSA